MDRTQRLSHSMAFNGRLVKTESYRNVPDGVVYGLGRLTALDRPNRILKQAKLWNPDTDDITRRQRRFLGDDNPGPR